MSNHEERPPGGDATGPAETLRERAESVVAEGTAGAPAPVSAAPLTLEATQRLLHDVQVHHVELELQNEELRSAQHALEAAHAHAFELYELAPVGYCTLREDGMMVRANVMAASLFGAPRQALVGQALSRFIHHQDQDAYYLLLKRLVETREPQTAELRVMPAQGSEAWVRLAANVGKEPKGARILRCTLTDISDRKRADEALQEREALLSAFVQRSPIYVYLKEVTPTESVVLRVSDNFGEVSGIPVADMVGKTMPELYPSALAARITADDWLVASSGQTLTLDEDFRGRSYSTTKFPLSVGGRQLLAGYTIDISQRKRAEETRLALEAQNHALQKSESLGRMASAIAHHFNNQLHALMMSLEVAMDELPRESGTVDVLTEAWQAARRAAEVSTQMLAYLGHSQGAREVLDLSELCSEQPPMPGAGVSTGVAVEVGVVEPDIGVRGNPVQLNRVLRALVSNAAEASADALGPVRISLHTVPADDLHVAHRFPLDWRPRAERYACLEVADSGSGILAADLERLFDPFFSTKFVGRGLGLPVALGIVRAHEGAISVETAPGKGSVFRVYLPVVEGAPLRRAVPRLRVPVTAPHGTVLLVDDEPGVRRAVARALRRAGYVVLSADDGAQAVELFRKHQSEIRCVLCDVSMPQMDGWETLNALHLLAPEVPVLLASGYSEAQVMEGEHPVPPAAFLSKPYQMEVLLRTLDEVMAPQASDEVRDSSAQAAAAVQGAPSK